MKNFVTIKDIAKVANISHTTVSRALSDSPLVTEETKKKILTCAKEMGYVPNEIAKGLVTQSTKTIGIILPSLTNPFFPELAEGMEDYANSKGYDVFICNSKMQLDKEKKSLLKLYSKRVDGIIISPVSENVSYILEQFPSSFPIVIFGGKAQENDCNYVLTDPYKCGYIAAEYLIKIGHKKISFIGGKENYQTTVGRFNGFCAALEANGLIANRDLIRIGDEGQEAGYKLTQQLLLESILPTGIVAYNDMTAIGVMQAIEDFGLKVPDNISIVGIDDIYFSRVFKIELTTVLQERYLMGQLSSEILIQKITNPDDDMPLKKVLDPKLIIRKSCKGIF